MGHGIVGIDEVGRGALAGPVMVAAAFLPKGMRFPRRELGELRDSKKLTPARRERWAAHFKGRPEIIYAIARVYPRGIERLNISRAANLAAQRAYRRLLLPRPGLGPRPGLEVVLDGGLFLGNGRQPKHAKTIVKGDEKIRAVAVASIIAKVARDRFMVRLAKKHTGYGFEVHKGYGTAAHRAAVRRHGPCPAHRTTFLGGTLGNPRKLTSAGKSPII